jgi:hypothetical protein
MIRRLVLVPMFALAFALLGAVTAGASSSDSRFGFHVGDAFFGAPVGLMAGAENGDTVKVIATGRLDAAAKTASGTGTFEHRRADGTLVGSGTLSATRLVSFQFYGCGGPGLPDFACGGLADIAVHLVGHPAGNPSVTIEADALLQANCGIAAPPPTSRVDDFIRLNVQDVINFNMPVAGGFTVFTNNGI